MTYVAWLPIWYIIFSSFLIAQALTMVRQVLGLVFNVLSEGSL